MEEDVSVNRMTDAINLFEDIVKHKSLQEVPIILLLNKSDRFEEKVKVTQVKTYLPDYPTSKQ